MTRRLAGAMTLAALACAASCGGAATDGPPELKLGVDVCDGCSMTIAEARHAAAALAVSGAGQRILKFDDIGCLARWEAKAPEPVMRRWVHDLRTEAWIDASASTFSRNPARMTPMGSGIAAFADPSEIDTTVNDGDEILSWDAILARAREGSLQRDPSVVQGARR